jgi:hypothetical protein
MVVNDEDLHKPLRVSLPAEMLKAFREATGLVAGSHDYR